MPEVKPEMNNRHKIATSFGSASNSYDLSARLQRHCGQQLIACLPNNKNACVVDLGSGTGYFTNVLANQYQHVIGVDISKKMLNFAKEHRNTAIHWLEGDAYNIPLQDNSVDVIFSNLMVQWCEPLERVLNEVMRVLKPGGLFVFSTLVDGTLFELKSSWAQVDSDKHVIDFKLANTILPLLNGSDRKLLHNNVEDIVLDYDSVLHLAHELKALGANYVPKKQGKGLAGKDSWKKMIAHYQQFQTLNGVYPATYKAFSAVVAKSQS